MVYSYLGLSEPINKVNETLVSALVSCRKQNGILTPPLLAGGVFSNNLSETAKFASETGMAIYTSADDLFRKSDIIFVFVPDSALRTLASSLRGHGIRDKIICHFSNGYNASVLDFDHMNTYVSLMHMCPGDEKPDFFISEGYGDMYETFLESLKQIGINIISVLSKDKSLMIAGLNMASKLPSMIDKLCDDVIKQAFRSNPVIGDILVENKSLFDISSNHLKNPHLLLNQKEAFKSDSLADAGVLYGAYLSLCASELTTSQNKKSELKKIAGQMINELLEEI